MKICYIADLNQVHSRRWIQEFIDRGHEISVINYVELKQSFFGCKIFDLSKGKNTLSAIDYLRVVPRVRQILNEIEPDILHAHAVNCASRLAVLSGFKPCIITAWGTDLLLDPKRSLIHKYLIKLLISRVDAVTVNSLFLGKTAISLGLSPDKLHMVKWGLNLNLFKPGIKVDSLREQLGLLNSLAIISPRSFRPLYNIDIVCKAIPSVLKIYPNVIFILKKYQADPEYENKINEMVKVLNMEKSVRFIDYIEDYSMMAKYYNLADIGISVPSSDSTPDSVMEMMACGVVPVVSDLPTVQEWNKDGTGGVVVPTGNPERLAEAIIELLKDKERRTKIIERNLKWTRENYNQTHWMNVMEELYMKIMNNSKMGTN